MTAIPIGSYGYTSFVQTAGTVGRLPQIIADMVAQGTTVLRLQLPWYLIDPSGGTTQDPTTYTWTGLDDAVSRCNAAGIFLYFSIMYAPYGTSGGNPINPSAHFPITSPQGFYTYAVSDGTTTQYVPDPVKLATFAIQIAQRYNGGAHGTIQCIEPGNEEYCLNANTNGVRDNGGTPAALALVNCYSSIKSANPGCYVAAASLLRQDLTGINTWLTLFNASGGFSHCDSVTYHLYKNTGTPPAGNGGPELGTVGFTAFWQQMHTTMASLGASVPIWCTECGYGIDNVDVNYQWLYAVEMMDSLSNSGGVCTMFLWYTIGNNDTKSVTQHGQIDSLAETWQPIFGVISYHSRLRSPWGTKKNIHTIQNLAELH